MLALIESDLHCALGSSLGCSADFLDQGRTIDSAKDKVEPRKTIPKILISTD